MAPQEREEGAMAEMNGFNVDEFQAMVTPDAAETGKVCVESPRFTS